MGSGLCNHVLRDISGHIVAFGLCLGARRQPRCWGTRRRLTGASSPSGTMDLEPVRTCDDDLMMAIDARKLSRRYSLAGAFLLPWFWVTNCWLFWPDLVHGRDPIVKRYTRLSAAWFLVYTAIFLPWMLIFLIGGTTVISQGVYDALDIMQIDTSGWGLGG